MKPQTPNDKLKKIETAKKFNEIRRKYKETLDPEHYPGSCSLIFELDTYVCIITTHNETYVGELSSFDNYGNVILSKARYRTINPETEEVHDTQLNILYFRSEQIKMIGEISQEKEIALHYAKAPEAE